MQLYQNQSCDPKTNAQSNLMGRTHYVDDGTLRFHKSRILSTYVMDDGLLFAIIESCSKNWDNTARGFRYVIFDIFGTTINRPSLDEMWTTSKAAKEAMWDHANKINAVQHTLKAIERAERNFATEMAELRNIVTSESRAA